MFLDLIILLALVSFVASLVLKRRIGILSAKFVVIDKKTDKVLATADRTGMNSSYFEDVYDAQCLLGKAERFSKTAPNLKMPKNVTVLKVWYLLGVPFYQKVIK